MLASNILTHSNLPKGSKEPLETRKEMLARYKELKSNTAVALELNTTRKTIRKWVKRFKGHVSSLKNHSKAPIATHLQIKDETKLSHIKYKSHSKDFWSKVKRFLPGYKAKEEKIKETEKLL